MPMTVGQAAELLGVTPDRVRQLIRLGRLHAERFGRAWMVDETDASRVAALVRPGGRPLSPGAAWAEIRRLERGGPRPDFGTLRSTAATLRGRSGADRCHVHPAAHRRMAEDQRLVAGGAAAAAAHGAPVIVVPPLDFYVRAGDLASVVADYKPVRGIPNLTLRPVENSVWPFNDGARMVGPVVSLLDLLDAGDRGAEEATTIWPSGS